MGKEAEIPATEETESEIDGCDCPFEEADATPDEDLPAAVGGVD